ncbi:hypothetical protein AALH12_07145 [Streptococcus ferus]|uniref:hypothetical protein n=1 Tax=Streptococcus ferus TaxID=1345 RepID=UPI003518D230
MFKKSYLILVALIVALLAYSVSANTVQTPNGYIDTSKKVLPKKTQGYQPPNVQEAQSQKAQAEKKKADAKKKAETKQSKDKKAAAAQKSAEYVDVVLSKKNASVAELKKAEAEAQKIKKYIADNKQYASTDEYKGLQETSGRWDETSTDKVAEAEEAEFIDNYLTNARDANDPSDMARLTSYLSVSGSLFGLGEIFPNAVNAIIQGIFFLDKGMYILTIIVLNQIFSQSAYDNLDAVVESSASVFNAFMTDFQYLIYGVALAYGLFYLLKYRRFPFGVFKFMLVWLVALFLYQPATVSDTFGSSDITATYNLSRLVKVVDGVGSEFAAAMISGFDNLDSNASNKDLGNPSEQAWESVKQSIFDEMVYEPFIALNFTKPAKGQDAVSEETVKKLIETEGDKDKIKGVVGEDKKITRLSWEDIGVKFLVALGAFFKGLILSLALIGIGLISLVFKYLAMILIVFLVLILFVAMLPSQEHVLLSFFKKLIQFVFTGALALAIIRAFLYVNGLISDMVSGVTDLYFWKAILQFFIWLVIWYFRGTIIGIFARGTLSARELAQRAQTSLDRVVSPPVVTDNGSFLPSRSLPNRSVNPEIVPSPSRELERTPKPSKLRTLSRANKKIFGKGFNQVMTDYDKLRHDGNHDLGVEKRQDLRQNLKDKASDVGYVLTKPLSYGLRSKIHDLAGYEDSPVQQKYRRRETERLERSLRRGSRLEERQQFHQFKQDNQDLLNRPLVNRRQVRKMFDREKEPSSLKKPRPLSPEDFSESELFLKR